MPPFLRSLFALAGSAGIALALGWSLLMTFCDDPPRPRALPWDRLLVGLLVLLCLGAMLVCDAAM